MNLQVYCWKTDKARLSQAKTRDLIRGLPLQQKPRLLNRLCVSCSSFCCRAAGIDSSSLTYVKPYCRIAPYLVGMVLGYLLVHAKNWKLPSKVLCCILMPILFVAWCLLPLNVVNDSERCSTISYKINIVLFVPITFISDCYHYDF